MLTITQLKKNEEGQWHSDTLQTLPDTISEDSILWIDAEDPSEKDMTQLKSRFGMKDLKLEELNKDGKRSQIEEYGDNISCFVSFPNSQHFISTAKKDWLAIEASKRWIISIHKGYSNITCEIYRKISTHGYFALSLVPSTDILFYIFLDLVTNECFLVSDQIHEKLQHLSQEAASRFRQKPKESSRTLGLGIVQARDQALGLRQSIGPLREVVGRAARGEFAIVSTATLARFEDLYDTTISLLDVVDSHREEIHDIGDILINVQTLTTNNIIRVLTIISAIFLPLTLIAGIYGTNFGRGFFVPGSNNSYGFYVMVASMISIAAGLIVIFRKKGWL